MADTQESYPVATNGIGQALFIKLSGINIENANPEQSSGALVGGNNTYKVTLSVANSISAGVSATVQVTASLYDLAGTFQSIAGSVTAISYAASATTFSGTQQSYPAPQTQVGEIATVGSVSITNSAGVATITPVNPGQAIIEFQYPFGGNAENPSTNSFPMEQDMIYSQILVTVLP